MVISVIYATVICGLPLVTADAMEFVKLLEYFLLFALVSNMRLTAVQLRRFYFLTLLTLLVSALVSFAQFLNLFQINRYLSPYYLSTQLDGLLRNQRVTGTTENPNVFGALMAMATCLALSAVLYIRHRPCASLGFPVWYFFLWRYC